MWELQSPNVAPLDALYQDSFVYVTSYVRKNGGDINDAKEIFQDALLVLLLNMKMNEFSIEFSLKGYLYKVAKNLWLKELKKRKSLALVIDDPDKNFDPIDEEANIQQDIESQERRTQYQKLMDQLDPKGRELFNLKLEGNLSDKEIAEEMNYSLDYVRQKRRRCLLYLRKRTSPIDV